MYDTEALKQLGVVQYTDPLLAQVSEPVTDFGKDTGRLVERMFKVMYAAPGAGLSAVQLGELKRMFVIDVGYRRNRQEPLVFINPQIEFLGEDQVSIEEGCLSFPNVYIPIKRPNHILVRYQDVDGAKKEMRADDLLSIVIQHEYDHLDGLTFLSRVSRLRKDAAMKKLKKLERAF